MRAILITRPGGPEVLGSGDVAPPDPGPFHVLVRVAATAVNRADLLERMGRYPPPPGWPVEIPGIEYAGVIEGAGPGAERWPRGLRVMGLVGGGSYAEYVSVHQDEVMPVPSSLSLEDAAAVPEAFITAHDALLTQASLRANETLLVHGVGSGVGTAAVQIASAVGARTIGTARSPWKLERARALGLQTGIDVNAGDFVDAVMRDTNGHGADCILDLVGGDYLGGNIRTLASRGRIVIVGLVAGARAELDMRALMSRRGTIRGTVLRGRSHEDKVAATRAFSDFALPLFEEGRLRPVIDCVLPLEHASEAHRRVERNENFGKVVLKL